jgi:ATP-dependent DNA helicase RecG
MLAYYTNAHAQLKAENIDGKIIQIIEYVIANGSIKNLEVQKLLSTSKPTATRLLKQTEKWLEMKNVGRRGIEYHLKRGF